MSEEKVHPSNPRCECCGGDGVLNPNLPEKDIAPIFTEVRFVNFPSMLNDGTITNTTCLTYFYKVICTGCSQRWQRMLMGDIVDFVVAEGTQESNETGLRS